MCRIQLTTRELRWMCVLYCVFFWSIAFKVFA